MPGLARERCAALEAANLADWCAARPRILFLFAAARKCGLYCYLGGVSFFFLFIACPRQHCEYFATLERMSAKHTPDPRGRRRRATA